MSGNTQRAFGFNNHQTINNIIVDEKYINSLISFKNNPSDLNSVVLSLYNNMNGYDGDIEKIVLPPEIETKISYNNVVLYRELIEVNYSENGFFLDAAYNSLDTVTPGRRKQFMKYINFLYLKTLGEFIKSNIEKPKIVVIRENADAILTSVANQLLINIAANPAEVEHLSKESIEYNVVAIVCHAFVDCKVLQNPHSI